MPNIQFDLPLPPSKNKRTTRKGVYVKAQQKFINIPVLSAEVLAYREEMALKLRRFCGMLPMDEKIIVECVWRKPRRNVDCVNYHDELCDAIAPPLGLNDKWFLVRDVDFTVEPKNTGVLIQMRPTGQLFKT